MAQGAYTFPSGSYYEGGFEETTGLFTGLGTFQNESEIIKGIWKGGKLNGPGERRYVNGDVYKGVWVDDNLEGQGSFEIVEGTYQGEFHKSLEHGSGLRKFSNGAYYIGEWQEGLKHGKGLLKNERNGVSYDGFWSRNQQEGFGILRDPYHYLEGMWKNGKLDGEGRMIQYDLDGAPVLEYKGQFKQGKFDGKGVFASADGTHYQGEFKNNLKNGFGILTIAENSEDEEHKELS